MPYSGADDKGLPSNVQKMPVSKRKKWVAVFNSCHSEDGSDESKCFAMANASVKTKGWIEGMWEVDSRQLSQDDAAYNPLGANDTMGCAACNWFVSPDSCVLVYGDISPTGICKMCMMRPEHEIEPMPVTIIEQDKSILARLKSWLLGGEVINSLENNADVDIDTKPAVLPSPAVQTVSFYKGEDGTYRFFTAFSNSYVDKHGETITEVAHKEYVDWVAKSGLYPDLRIWHCGVDSRIGKVDFVDYIDGFTVASGIIDKEKEHIAESFNGQDIATSHGFVGLITKSGEVLQYRTFEISVLPPWGAANTGTNFNIKSIGEKEMPFSDAKKAWLKEVAKADDATIAAWEKSVEELSNKFKELGIEYKEGETADIATEIQTVTKAISDLAGVVKEQQATLANISKSQDERIAESLKAEIAKLPQGFRASESTDNVITKEKAAGDISWFNAIVEGVTKNG